MTDDELDGLAHLVKPLEWSERMVFGTRKWQGRGQFGEFASFSGNDLTEEQVAAEKVEIESDYARRILSALNLDALRSAPDVGDSARLKSLIGRYSDHVAECEGVDFLESHKLYDGAHITEDEAREIRGYSQACALAETTKGGE